MTFRLQVETTNNSDVFRVWVPAEEMVRLRNIGACSNKDVRATIEALLNDGVGMAQSILEAKHEDLAAALKRPHAGFSGMATSDSDFDRD